MIRVSDVLGMLCPGVEWTVYGDKFEDIIWHNGESPITKKQFTDGFAKFEDQKAKQDAAKAKAKAELLDRLGITAEEAQLLLS
jgi:hypothetical protein